MVLKLKRAANSRQKSSLNSITEGEILRENSSAHDFLIATLNKKKRKCRKPDSMAFKRVENLPPISKAQLICQNSYVNKGVGDGPRKLIFQIFFFQSLVLSGSKKTILKKNILDKQSKFIPRKKCRKKFTAKKFFEEAKKSMIRKKKKNHYTILFFMLKKEAK